MSPIAHRSLRFFLSPGLFSVNGFFRRERAWGGWLGGVSGPEGVAVEVGNETFKTGETGVAHVMLDPFDVGVESGWVEADEAEELAEKGVAFLDRIRHGLACCGQHKPPVRLAP